MFWRKLGKCKETTLIVGLGNPGKKYESSRHNCGYRAIDRLADHYGLRFTSKKYEGEIAKGEIDGRSVILIKPLTFMNDSGRCVRKFVQFYKTDITRHLVVLYDDIDLEVGSMRVRAKGSAGSHNGMKSIVQNLKSESFPRVRIGIGAPPPRMDLVDWVLGKVPKSDEPALAEVNEQVCDVMPVILDGDLQEAMNRYNRRG